MEDGHLGMFEAVGLVLILVFCNSGHGSFTVVVIVAVVALVGSVWLPVGLCPLGAVRCVVTTTMANVAGDVGEIALGACVTIIEGARSVGVTIIGARVVVGWTVVLEIGTIRMSVRIM